MDEPSPPYHAYAAITGTFVGVLGVTALAARLLGRDPPCQTRPSISWCSRRRASRRARTFARDEVTSFIREPFVRGRGPRRRREPVQTGGLQQAIGELVTCTRCVGTWAGAGLASTQVLRPRFGRLLTWSLAAAGVNDWLQAGFAALTAKANELEQHAG